MDKMVLSLPTGFVNDNRKDGWTLLEDVPLEGTPTLELAEFLKDGENGVNGETMLSRAKELGNLCGQHHAERLLVLADHTPESWRDFNFVFPGTVWLASGGDRVVPSLRRHGDGRWGFFWNWLGDDLRRNVRLVRLSK